MIPRLISPDIFKDQSILVIGDIMLDEYWHGNTKRISSEAPVPIVNINEQDYRLGGAANVALNLATLGINVGLIGIIGDDEHGKILAQLIANAGINFCPFVLDSYQTINKLRILSGNQQIIRIDREQSLGIPLTEGFYKLVEQELGQYQTIVLSDYGKGALSHVSKIIEYAGSLNIKTLVDPKGDNFEKYAKANVITPNEHEFRAIVGNWSSSEQFEDKGRSLMKQLELDALLVTRGSIGMSMFLNDQVVNIPVESSQVFDVTGAGDTVIAFLAAGIAIGESYADSARLANLAASLSVQKRGSSSVPLAELLKKIEPNKIYSSLENMSLTKQVASYRSQGKKIVMTNGCFDILHAGHIKYLESAKKCGDVLIIAVNDDASVSALKGVSRPLNILEDRLTLLASLECVDMVVPFSEDTPINIIKSIRPDVLVKGGDYKEDNIVGADFVKSEGGEVKMIAFIKGKSTTNLINKIINDLA